MMRAWTIPAAALLQVLVLGAMVAQREAVLLWGETVRLRSAPIDPRDIFRGDYVRLTYEASSIPRARWRGGLASRELRRGERIYAVLEVGRDGLARVASVSDRRPDEGLFLRGRVKRPGHTLLHVTYGIEAYFMEQGTAIKLEEERIRGGRDEIPVQVPLDMDVAVGAHGIAVLRGHSWAPLGLGLRVPPGRMQAGQSPPEWDGVVELAWLNASEKPLAIVDLPRGGSFDLLPIERWQSNPYRWVGRSTALPEVRDEHVKLLGPGERYRVTIHLREPQWCLTHPDREGACSIPDLHDVHYWFRLAYRPPPSEHTAGLRHADAIWHGELLSRAFNGRRMVD